MKSNNRDELLNVLQELSRLTPQIRLGQLVSNLAYRAKGATAEAIWDVTDEELLQAARDQLEALQADLLEGVSELDGGERLSGEEVFRELRKHIAGREDQKS